MESGDVNAKSSQQSKKAEPKSAKHPSYKDMVTQTVRELNQRNGSSRAAVVNYVMMHFNVGSDSKRVNGYVKAALMKGIEEGSLFQPKGSGITGYFKPVLAKIPKSTRSPSKKPTEIASPHASESDVGKHKPKPIPKKKAMPSAAKVLVKKKGLKGTMKRSLGVSKVTKTPKRIHKAKGAAKTLDVETAKEAALMTTPKGKAKKVKAKPAVTGADSKKVAKKAADKSKTKKLFAPANSKRNMEE